MRLKIIACFLGLLFALIIARLVYVQCFHSDIYKNIAKRQRKSYIRIPPARGIIFDRNGHPLALNNKVKSLYTNPKMISRKEVFADEIAKIIGEKPENILARINRDKYFVWLKRTLPEDVVATLQKTPFKSIGFVDEMKRYYPTDETAAHIIGYSNVDNEGLEGIEYKYDGYLSGQRGWLDTTLDAKRREVPARFRQYMPPVNGHHVRLTIDETIQQITRNALEKAVIKRRAKRGTVVVMDPYTGHVLALSNVPTYNLNKAHYISGEHKRNEAVAAVYEPGSIFKVITAAAVLEEKTLKPSDVIYCENGELKKPGGILHDHKPHANLSFKNVIVKSSNIGTVKAALTIGNEKLYKYIKLFGFGEKTGIDLPGEVRGILAPTERWSRASIYAIPMGQEVAVTAIQMASAIAAIASDGIWRTPLVVDEVRDELGVLIKKNRNALKRRVISKRTSRLVKEIMRGVVEEGTGRRAKLDGYSVAGKTGTAQKVNEDGTYSHSRFIASFVGFAPVDRPKIVILVSIDEPRPVYYGGVVAAPVFQEIAGKVLRYLEVSGNKELKADQ